MKTTNVLNSTSSQVSSVDIVNKAKMELEQQKVDIAACVQTIKDIQVRMLRGFSIVASQGKFETGEALQRIVDIAKDDGKLIKAALSDAGYKTDSQVRETRRLRLFYAKYKTDVEKNANFFKECPLSFTSLDMLTDFPDSTRAEMIEHAGTLKDASVQDLKDVAKLWPSLKQVSAATSTDATSAKVNVETVQAAKASVQAEKGTRKNNKATPKPESPKPESPKPETSSNPQSPILKVQQKLETATAKLNTASNELGTLRKKNAELEKSLKDMTKQRDMYKSICSTLAGIPLNGETSKQIIDRIETNFNSPYETLLQIPCKAAKLSTFETLYHVYVELNDGKVKLADFS